MWLICRWAQMWTLHTNRSLHNKWKIPDIVLHKRRCSFLLGLWYDHHILSHWYVPITNQTQHIQVNHHQPASQTSIDWCFAGVQIVARYCVLSELYFEVSKWATGLVQAFFVFHKCLHTGTSTGMPVGLVISFTYTCSSCSATMCGSRGGRGSGPPPPWKITKNIGFLSNTGLDHLKNHKANKPAFNDGQLLVIILILPPLIKLKIN